MRDGNIKSEEESKYWSKKKAQAFLKSQDITKVNQTKKWVDSPDRPPEFPPHPPTAYKEEWKGWGEFVGTDESRETEDLVQNGDMPSEEEPEGQVALADGLESPSPGPVTVYEDQRESVEQLFSFDEPEEVEDLVQGGDMPLEEEPEEQIAAADGLERFSGIDKPGEAQAFLRGDIPSEEEPEEQIAAADGLKNPPPEPVTVYEDQRERAEQFLSFDEPEGNKIMKFVNRITARIRNFFAGKNSNSETDEF